MVIIEQKVFCINICSYKPRNPETSWSSPIIVIAAVLGTNLKCSRTQICLNFVRVTLDEKLLCYDGYRTILTIKSQVSRPRE